MKSGSLLNNLSINVDGKILPSLKRTAKEQKPPNYQFSGANLLLVSGTRVFFPLHPPPAWKFLMIFRALWSWSQMTHKFLATNLVKLSCQMFFFGIKKITRELNRCSPEMWMPLWWLGRWETLRIVPGYEKRQWKGMKRWLVRLV